MDNFFVFKFLQPSCTLIFFFYTLGQPKIKDFKSSKNVVQGDNMVLKCPVTGYPYPVVTWYKDDNPIDTSVSRVNSETFDHVKNAKLIIYTLDFSDKGKYKCYVNSTHSGYNNTEAVIDIKVKGNKLGLLRPILEVCPRPIVIGKISIMSCKFGKRSYLKLHIRNVKVTIVYTIYFNSEKFIQNICG